MTNVDPTGHVSAGSYVGANIDNARNYGDGSDLYWQVRSNLGSQAKSFIPGARNNDNNDFKFLFGVATMTSAYSELNNKADANWAKERLVSMFQAQYEAEQEFIGGAVSFVCMEICSGTVKAESKAVNGNSVLSTKAQHGYEIFEKSSGDVVKNGISGRALNKNGTSPRANQQVNSLNKAEGFDKYDARVVEQFSNRADALNWEYNYGIQLWKNNNSMRLHSNPRGWED